MKRTLLVLLFLSVSPLAVAGKMVDVDEEGRAKALAQPEAKEHGFKLKAQVGLSGAINHSDSVVGQDDGLTVTAGVVLGASARYLDDTHDWETTLSIKETQTKTPAMPFFVKSQDELLLKSTYYYHFDDLNWVGPFGRLKLITPMFDGHYVSTEPKTVVLPDGTTQDLPAQRRLQGGLTGAFEPLTLRETAGAYANPLVGKSVTIKTKLGVGAQQILAHGGRVVASDEGGVVTLTALDSTNELGAETEFDIKGVIVDDLVTYSLNVNLFLPLVTSGTDTDLSLGDSINAEIEGKLSLKVVKWMSIDYVLTARRLPLVQTRFQVQNALLLTAAFSLI